MVCYAHLFKNFPHSQKDFGIVSKAEIDAFLELSFFPMTGQMLAIRPLVPLPFLNPLEHGLAWRSLSITLLACETSAIVR